LWQIWGVRNAGPHALEAVRRYRLDNLVRFARRHSPLYREAYRGVPEGVFTPDSLPVMTKQELMSRFDDWITDRAIRRRDVEAFVADRTRVGERFLDRYLVWKSSGTSGEPGLYVQDDDALNVYDALITAPLASPELANKCAEAVCMKGGRAALIVAVGEHFASTVTWERMRGSARASVARSYSIMEPLERLVSALNAFSPASIASYPTMLSLLADELVAGRLRVNPSMIWSAGERLAPHCRTRLESAFDCPVINEYGASECISMAFGCREGWLHVNADWVLLEPVDSDYRPTPVGETSHTVLVTNLANRVQPVIRYDLGDAVLVKPERCNCGNPLPAIRVEGRCDDIVVMRSDHRHEVKLVPQALTTVVEESADIHRFQIVHDGANRLKLRLEIDNAQRKRAAFATAVKALRGYLANQGIADAQITLDQRPPIQDARSGKLQQVVIERRGAR
jgi:putative adenylate-forming enzyme